MPKILFYVGTAFCVFLALSGAERIVFDADPRYAADEEGRFARKGSRDEEP